MIFIFDLGSSLQNVAVVQLASEWVKLPPADAAPTGARQWAMLLHSKRAPVKEHHNMTIDSIY